MKRRPVPWILIPVLLLAFWFGAHGLYMDTVWSDEIHSIEDSAGMPDTAFGVGGIWNNLAQTNPWHVPGYFYALNGWGTLVGWEPPALRALSLLAGMLTLAWTYRLGRAAVSRQAAVYATVVMASSTFFLHFLHELRMYTLVTLFAAIAAWLYLRMVRRQAPTRGQWVALFLVSAALLYTHYFAAMILFGICLFHLLCIRKDRRWAQFMLTFALAGLTFLPWIGALASGVRLAIDNETIHEQALLPLEATGEIAWLASNGDLILLVPLLIAAVIAAQRQPRARYLLFIAAATLGLSIAVASAFQIMTEGRIRYLLTFWPLLSIILALGMLALPRWLPERFRWRRWISLALLLVWLATGLYRNAMPDFLGDLDGGGMPFAMHQVAYAIGDKLSPDDLIIEYLAGNPKSPTFYSATATTKIYFRSLNTPYEIYPASDNLQERQQQLTTLIARLPGHTHVWLIYNQRLRAPDMPAMKEVLNAHYVACSLALNEVRARVEEFAPQPEDCIAANPIRAFPL